MDKFYEGCCLEHLPKDCPTRLSSAHATEAKASMNYIEVIPSPNEEETEADRRSLNVITRSQSKKQMTTLENKEPQTETPAKKKRGRKPRSRWSKKSQIRDARRSKKPRRGKCKKPSPKQPSPKRNNKFFSELRRIGHCG